MGPTDSPHQKHAKCGDTTTLGVSLLPVCKSFFSKIQILDIGHAYIQHAVENCQDGIFTGEERRGKRTASEKIPEEKNSQLKKHMESFPGTESHYCRKETDKKKKKNHTSTPVYPSTKCTEWMPKKTGRWGPSQYPAPSTVTHSSQTITLLSADQSLLYAQLCT